MANQDEWLMQLWSGTIGAAFSAVLAALVAVGVVVLTNKLQRDLAEKAMAKNDKIAAEQLDHARQQLEEQREEASRAREYAAIADLVSLTAIGRDVQREEAFFLQYEQNVLAAVVRWQLELDENSPMRAEIREWTPFLVQLARNSHQAGLTVDPVTLQVDADSDLERRQNLVKSFSEQLIDWPGARTSEEQAKIVGLLKRVRTAGSSPLEDDPLFAGWL
jgi:hypothetical protein